MTGGVHTYIEAFHVQFHYWTRGTKIYTDNACFDPENDLAMAAVWLTTFCIIVAIGGWILITSILAYMETKPLGKESIIDIPLRFQFRLLRLYSAMHVLHSIVHNNVHDPGDMFTNLWMWPHYNVATLAIVSVAYTPLIQLILMRNPSLELPLNDKTAYHILALINWIPMIIMSIVCHYKGIYPPNYYSARNMPLDERSNNFYVARYIIGICCITFLVFARSYISCKQSKTKETSNPLMTGTTMAFSSGSMAILILLYNFFNLRRQVGIPITAFIFLNLFPLLTIYNHDKLKAHFQRSHPKIALCLEYFPNKMAKLSNRNINAAFKNGRQEGSATRNVNYLYIRSTRGSQAKENVENSSSFKGIETAIPSQEPAREINPTRPGRQRQESQDDVEGIEMG